MINEVTKDDIKKAYKILDDVGVFKIEKKMMRIIHVLMDFPKSKEVKTKDYLDIIYKKFNRSK